MVGLLVPRHQKLDYLKWPSGKMKNLNLVILSLWDAASSTDFPLGRRPPRKLDYLKWPPGKIKNPDPMFLIQKIECKAGPDKLGPDRSALDDQGPDELHYPVSPDFAYLWLHCHM